MNAFRNGRRFSVAIQCCPPPGHALPEVRVRMARFPRKFVYVVGKVDTGAFRTMLTFATARALGIANPRRSPAAKSTARTATGQPLAYYIHRVRIRISGKTRRSLVFPLNAAFAARVKRNLFGLDWLPWLCLAVDFQAVHFLAD